MIVLLVIAGFTACTMLAGAVLLAALNSRIRSHLIHRQIARHQILSDQ